MNLENLLRFAGVVQLGILVASALTPGVLDWPTQLAALPRLLRQLIWVHGAFIVLVIVGFGLLALTEAPLLADGSRLGRSVCGFISLFWLSRLGVQFLMFDATPYLDRLYLAIGYRGLTLSFAYLAIVFGWAALG